MKNKSLARPIFVSEDMLNKWNQELILSKIPDIPELKEVCYAGMWLREQLLNNHCSHDLADAIQYSAANLSHKLDIWSVHQKMLEEYLAGSFAFIDISKKDIN